MRRSFSSRAIGVAMLMTLAWLPFPAVSLAQVVQVLPYVQPGDGSALSGTDVKVICWLTDQTPGVFVVEFFEKGGEVRTAKPVRIALDFAPLRPEPKKDPLKNDDVKKEAPKEEPKSKDDDDDDPKTDKKKEPPEARMPAPSEKGRNCYRYMANLDQLPFNSDITYRVKLDNKIIREATFRTRATQDKSVRCVLVGDMAQGRYAQNEVAYRISQERPEFLIALGDVVYPAGQVSQYAAYYWDTYVNVAKASLKTGAPLMASVPFYPVLGNHDVNAKLSKTPDALGIYYFFFPPKNGPGEGPWNTPLDGKDAINKKFREATADSFPYIDTYSFDNGPAHFVVINTNRPVDAPAFQKWLVNDLKSTRAKWKVVCFHIPGFQSSIAHYPEQQLRRLQPIFEEYGVDLCFGGHVHNYQRTVPIKFVPRTFGKGKNKAQVNGDFTLDTTFDGIKNTQANGVIHIVAGGGGARLYGPGLEDTAKSLKKKYGPDNYVDFTARMVVDRHSFVVLDISPTSLNLRALGASGDELDRITLTKGK